MGFDQIVGIIIEQTAPVALAVFAMWMLNRTWEARSEDSKQYTVAIVAQRSELLDALNRNTEAITILCTMAKSEKSGQGHC